MIGMQLWKSFIRTAVPVLVGVVVSGLSAVGFELTDKGEQWLSNVIGGAIALAFYVIVRVTEERVPWVGALLGSPNPPTYISQWPWEGEDVDPSLAPDDEQAVEDPDDELSDEEGTIAEDAGEPDDTSEA